jgi:hypothetical protein
MENKTTNIMKIKKVYPFAVLRKTQKSEKVILRYLYGITT